MLHELIGIHNNRVDTERKQKAIGDPSSGGSSTQEKEFVVSDHDDQFYCDNMYDNFGELAENIRIFIESVLKNEKMNEKIHVMFFKKSFRRSRTSTKRWIHWLISRMQ